VIGVQFAGVANGNPTSMIRLFDIVIITIQSPQNKSYNVNTVPINFTYETNNYFPSWWDSQATCIINKEKPFKINATIVGSRTETTSDGIKYTRWTLEGGTILSNLTDGTYFLVFQRPGNPAEPVVSANVSFTVDTAPPLLQILQPEHRTFNSSSIPLNFATNEPSSVSYSLDGLANVTVSENTTLTGLANGSHSLALYAADAGGNVVASEIVLFNVNALWWAPYGLVAVAAVVAVAAMVYLRIRQRSLRSKR